MYVYPIFDELEIHLQGLCTSSEVKFIREFDTNHIE